MADGFQVRWTIRANNLPKIRAGMEQRAGQFVRKAALDIEASAKRRAPIDTGMLRNSIQATKVAPFYYRVVVGAEYGVYVEWGTRFAAAQPFLAPAVAEVRPQYVAAMRSIAA